MQPNDHQLRVFLAVARAGSLRAAADMLGVTQPALSKQMAALEQTLGVRLFRRTGRGMALTDRGQQLFRTMSHSYDIVDAAYGAAAASAGRLSIATVNTLAAYLLPDAMVRLAQRCSGVTGSMMTASSPEVVERVERGYCELGLVYDSAVDSDAFAVHRLHVEHLCGYLAARENTPVAFNREQLLLEPLIVAPRTYALRRALERELGGAPRVAFECNSINLSLDFAARGLGIAVLPRHLPDSMIVPRGLSRAEVFEGRLQRQVVAISRKSEPMTATAAAALEAVRAIAQALQP